MIELFHMQFLKAQSVLSDTGFYLIKDTDCYAEFENNSQWRVAIIIDRWDISDNGIWIWKGEHRKFYVKQISYILTGRKMVSFTDQLDFLISHRDRIFITPNEYEAGCDELNTLPENGSRLIS